MASFKAPTCDEKRKLSLRSSVLYGGWRVFCTLAAVLCNGYCLDDTLKEEYVLTCVRVMSSQYNRIHIGNSSFRGSMTGVCLEGHVL